MGETDCVTIDPSGEAFDRVLRSAVTRANDRARSRKLPWPLAEADDFLAKVRREPEGWRQWVADGGRVRSGEACSLVLVAWWTDRLGRKHYRVVGQRGIF